MDLLSKYSTTTATMKSSMIRELVSSTKGIPGLISFAGGFPSPKTFPVDELGEIFKKVIVEHGTDVLQYGASEGDQSLKNAIKKWENKPNLHDDELVVVSGSTNGIYYFARAVINPGDVILCEGPSFLGSVVALEACGAEVVPVNMDDEGLIVEELNKTIARLKSENKTIKFLYTIPDFQNPTGVTLTYQRRKAIIETAIKNDFLILEDDPYSQLRYKGEMVKSMIDIAREEFSNDKVVTSVKSFSKILGPGLRIAYIMGHEDIIRPIISWVQKVTLSPECVAERAVAIFMNQDKLNPHIQLIRDYYAPYLEKMLECLEKYMPKEITWANIEGGIFLWLTCPDYINTDELFKLARDEKVSFIPGSQFYPTNYEKHNSLRLNFSYPTLDQIDDGIKRLANLLKAMI